MPAKKTLNSPKAAKSAATQRVTRPAAKTSNAAKKPPKKVLVKKSAPKKATVARKTTPNKKIAAMSKSAKQPAIAIPKIVSTKQPGARTQGATAPTSARTSPGSMTPGTAKKK